MLALIQAATETNTTGTDLLYGGVSLAITAVVCALLLLLRWKMSSQGMRDFLGITAAFFVLSWIGFAMIIAEKLLG